MQAIRHLRRGAILVALGCACTSGGAAQDPDVPQGPTRGADDPITGDQVYAAEVALRRLNYEEAIRAATAAVRNGLPAQRLVLALRLRGAAFLNTKRPEKAVADFHAALRLEPRDVVALIGRGAGLIALGRAAEAHADFDRALGIQRAPVLYYWRGLARFRLRDFRGAMADFDAALALHPRYVPGYYGRGLAYHALGHDVRARDDYERALAIDPTFSAAREALQALQARRPAPGTPAAPASPAGNGVVQF